MINKKLKTATFLFIAIAHQYINSMERSDMEQSAIEALSELRFEGDLDALSHANLKEYSEKRHYRLMFDVMNNNYQHAKKILKQTKKGLNPLPFVHWIDQYNEQLGHSALTLATENGFTDIIRLLISFGASPYSLNGNGLNAITIAEIKKVSEETEGQNLLAILRATTRPGPKPVYPKSIIRILCEEQRANFDGLRILEPNLNNRHYSIVKREFDLTFK